MGSNPYTSVFWVDVTVGFWYRLCQRSKNCWVVKRYWIFLPSLHFGFIKMNTTKTKQNISLKLGGKRNEIQCSPKHFCMGLDWFTHLFIHEGLWMGEDTLPKKYLRYRGIIGKSNEYLFPSSWKKKPDSNPSSSVTLSSQIPSQKMGHHEEEMKIFTVATSEIFYNLCLASPNIFLFGKRWKK